MLGALLLSLIYATSSQAFTFSSNEPTQCDAFNVSWSGGQPPFQLELVPLFGTQIYLAIPSSSFTNGVGSFSTQLALPENSKFLMVMSDATGFASGGISDILTVGASISGQSCNTTDPGVQFTFQLNDALQQCLPYTFSGYTGAVQPVTIQVLIPGGQSLTLQPPVGSNSFDWTAAEPAGTSLIFTMVDSKGRVGGSSDVVPVQNSNVNSCLNGTLPSSTANPPAPTGPTSTASSVPAATTTVHSGPAASGGTIAGTVVGAIVAIAVLVSLFLFFLRRKRSRGSYGTARRNSSRLESVDLSYDPVAVESNSGGRMSIFGNSSVGQASHYVDPSPHSALPPGQWEPTPFLMHSSIAVPELSAAGNEQEPQTPEASFLGPSTRTSVSSAGRRKAAMAGISSYRPSRFVLHADADDEPAAPVEDIVELPPRYTDRRHASLDTDSAPPPSDANSIYPSERS